MPELPSGKALPHWFPGSRVPFHPGGCHRIRDYRIFEDFGYHLIGIARKLYAGEERALELQQSLYVLDSTTVDLCLSLFPWARFRSTKSAVKIHILLDLKGTSIQQPDEFIRQLTGQA